MKYKNILLPDELRPLTYQFVKSVIDTFKTENKLSALDNLSFYLLANNVDGYLLCQEHITAEGLTIESDRGNTSLSPYVVQQKVYHTSITTILREMGLTLGSRSKLKVIQNETEESPLASFIRGSK